MIRHIGIVTSHNNIKKMLRFYNILGFKLFQKDCESNETMHKYTGLNSWAKIYKLISQNNSVIEILVFLNNIRVKKMVNSMSITHIAFTVQDIEKMKVKVICGGGKILSKNKYRKNKNSPWVMFCKDPDGNILELVQGKY